MKTPTRRLAFLAAIFSTGVQSDCPFQNTTCIDPVGQASVPFEFKPLFPTNPKFVYAFDARTADQVKDMTLEIGAKPGPRTKIALWLEFTKPSLAPNAHMQVEVAALMHENITGTPGGGNNGCDNVWGSPCSENLKSDLKKYMARNCNNIDCLSTSLAYLRRSNLSCPDGIFPGLSGQNPYLIDLHPTYNPEAAHIIFEGTGTGGGTGTGSQSLLAVENGANTYIKLAGNASSPWSAKIASNTSAEAQFNRVAVGMIARIPQIEAERTVENIQLEFVCAKATPFTKSGKADSASVSATPKAGSGGIVNRPSSILLVTLFAILFKALIA